MVVNYSRMRYPQSVTGFQVPHDVYTREQATCAQSLAQQIVDKARQTVIKR